MIPPTPSLGNSVAAEHAQRIPLHLGDLEIAWQVQQRLFPRTLPALPGWEFAAVCRPARIVSGDYYDLFEVGPDQIAFALGDVSGKGLGAALVMAGLHALIRTRLPHRTSDLGCLMGEVNAYLLAATPPDLFVTLFLGLLDTHTGQLRYVNAGHPPPVLLRGAGEEVTRLGEGGTVLGILAETCYREGQAELEREGVLAVFSDGITEASNEDRVLFRERRVLDALRASRLSSAEDILTHLLEAVDRFTNHAEPEDDISLLIGRRKGTQRNAAISKQVAVRFEDWPEDGEAAAPASPKNGEEGSFAGRS
jgi:sigma-B regulation protein RsbU (phosphoserine phosphatase)